MSKKLYEKSLREQISDKCIHFNGTMNDACEAGVTYEKFMTASFGRVIFPCWKEHEENQCDKREWPSEEYVQARLDAIEESCERHRKAGVVVADFRKRYKGKSGQETVDCPACGTGKLHLSIAGYNGHVWGRCETEGCLAWVE
jgi:hypothetical protein